MASFIKGSLPISEHIGVIYVGINDEKVYEPISYDNQVSQYENFTDKAYPASRSSKTCTPVKRKRKSNTSDATDQLYWTAISQI